MQNIKKIQDIMVGIFDYPHVPYWFSVSQAIKIVRVSLASSKKDPDPIAVLVFDEKYNLMGILTLEDLLKGLEPRFLQNSAHSPPAGEAEGPVIWDVLFSGRSKEVSEKQVSDIMTPVNYFVEPGDSVKKAAYLLVQHDQMVLPVLEQGRKLVGLVRLNEVFAAISDEIIME